MTEAGAQPATIYLQDYRPPQFLITTTVLRIDLDEKQTRVDARLSIQRNPAVEKADSDIVLHGAELRLQALAIDDRVLAADEYSVDRETLTIYGVPDNFALTSTVTINPRDNTSLEGLYQSRGMYCTQCEAEGFRKITYYFDRPDVMSEFTTTICADKDRYPVLLANGNPQASGDLPDGRHWVTWHDPFKKPAYLFAMVAGNLECVEDSFTTMSGRKVSLRMFVEAKDLDKCAHAMQSLQRAMLWDEQVYGREYDLDIFMIVAVDDFNMGAMENKGLNIFNTSCVLARPEITTDSSFQWIEAVVAHEYFHNWSGNRVTCRDWFQLSLKEGFTVFRDAEFSADMGSRAVTRIQKVNALRTIQFAEDSGPTAHAVQPASYMEISNFYTATIYEKGAELVRMLHTLLGPEEFRRGSDLYFERHDGQAVTIEDFVAAMATASGRDLTQFLRWYRRPGTPRLQVVGDYDAERKSYRLTFSQFSPTPSQGGDTPLHIPIRMGLVGAEGDISLHSPGVCQGVREIVFELTEREQTLIFEGVQTAPVPSLLRQFSAPVRLEFTYTREDLLHLMRRDSDDFNRWSACQKLALEILQEMISGFVANRTPGLDRNLVDAYRHLLRDPAIDRALLALMLTLPSEAYLSEEAEVIYVEAIHRARQLARQTLSQALHEDLLRVYHDNNHQEPYQTSARQIAQRSLKNIVLQYLVQGDVVDGVELAWRQFEHADNMTDVQSALTALINCPNAIAREYSERGLASFYQKWRAETLVVNQWFSLQASCVLPGGLERVKGLMTHSAFDLKNPNKVRSLLGVFVNNASNFHREDGASYKFLAEQVVVLDKLNPQMASRLIIPLTRWRKFPSQRATQMRTALETVREVQHLSRDLFEIVSKSL